MLTPKAKGKSNIMATYHLSVKVGKVGTGAAHSDYITRGGRYAAKSKDDLEHTESGNLPDWAGGDPRAFWEASDLYERKNGSVYREFEVALPRELDPAQRLALVREFVGAELGNHAYTFAIHNPKAAIDGGEQPHAHIMYSERLQDGIERTATTHFKRANKKSPERGGCAKSDRFSGGKLYAERKEAITALRANWADLQNQYLEKYGHEARVDHRSLKAQGINPSERVAESKLGPKKTAVYGQDLAAQRQQKKTKAIPQEKEQPVSQPVIESDSELRKEAEEWRNAWLIKSPTEQAQIQRDLATVGKPMPEPTVEENIVAFERHLKGLEIPENAAKYKKEYGEVRAKGYDKEGKLKLVDLKKVLRGPCDEESSVIQQRDLAEEKEKMWLRRDDDKVSKLEMAIEAARVNGEMFSAIREDFAKFLKEHMQRLKEAWEKKQKELQKLAEKLKRIGPTVKAIDAEKKALVEARRTKPRTPEKERGIGR